MDKSIETNNYLTRTKKNRLYNIWQGIKTRCYNPHYYNFAGYGGRGIVMCDEWLNDFYSFREWSLSHGYNDKRSIDRIDNNGNYTPDNCRWTTPIMQCNNKRNNIVITHNGVSKTLTQWCNEYNLCVGTIYDRIRNGWDPEDAITVPTHFKDNLIFYNGRMQSMSAWAKELNIQRHTLFNRINVLHWPIEKAFSEPIRKNSRRKGNE